MYILHISLLDGRCVLWGERSAETATAKRRGRPAKLRKVRTSPYDAGADLLRMLSGDERIALPDELRASFRKKRPQTAHAWLPSSSQRPVASSALIDEREQHEAAQRLEAWEVTAFACNPMEVQLFLAAIGGKHTIAPGIVAGSDVTLAWHVLQLAGSLVARQQFLPSIIRHDKEKQSGAELSACWKPVVSGADIDRVAMLAAAMPASWYALSNPGTAAPPPVRRKESVESLLGSLVDIMVRSTARRDEERRALADRPFFSSVHDQWLLALQSGDGLMRGDPKELQEFAQAVDQWQHPLLASTSSRYRLVFRLIEPQQDVAKNTDWSVEYLLQALEDKSLLIPLREIWNAHRMRSAVVKKAASEAREYLLTSLGQAAALSEEIHESLKSGAPAGFTTKTDRAYVFLTEISIALEQAGFGILLPAWWTRKGTKLQITARAKVNSPAMPSAGHLTLDRLVAFDWELALGNEKISLRELRALARLKSPLVQWRGQWVELNAQEIASAVEFWTKHAQGSATVAQMARMKLGIGEALHGIEFTGVDATGWVGTVLDQLDGHVPLKEVPVSGSFTGTLRPYQSRGLAWLAFLRQWNLGACLADDMGLGKTIQVLALLQRGRDLGETRPVLLICPMSVVTNWQKEAQRFTPRLSVMIHHGTIRERGTSFERSARAHAVVVSTYALLQRDIDHLQHVEWAGIILDEAQNIKNAGTKQSRAARSVKAGYRIALTGTPVENNVGDLWSIMEFLNPGFLGTQAEFKRRYFIPIQTGQDPSALERLKRLTAPFILRRLKTDRTVITDLPEKMEMKVYCPLTKEQASLYASVVRTLEESLDGVTGINRKGLILASLSKLKQICNHPAQFLGDNSSIDSRSGKLARLTEMLDEVIASGEKALVFTQFAEMGMILKKHLQYTLGMEIPFLHGAVTKKDRDRMVDAFQHQADSAPVFLLSLKAGGTGLNLTRASHVFHYDRWWNPAVENQATDRAYRIGQRKNVQVHKFICAGTMEDAIDEMIERKQSIADRTVGSGEAWLTEFSNKELMQVFALRAEAMTE